MPLISYHVADVYEAWALFQFVKLTLDILRSSLKKISEGDTGADAERREVARGLLVAHKALDSITYTGVVMFLVVCVGQAGWALYRLTFTDPTLNGWESYNNQLSLFKAAGFIASAAAIYNVHIVESEFHCFFVGYSPLLKFVTVKILLSLAFFQAGAFYAIQTFNKTLPNVLQDVSKRIPFVADILQFNDSQFYLFYSSLILYECVLGVLLHWFAWSSSESFYLEHNDVIEGDEEAIAEKTPLVDKTEKTSYSSWLFG
ncbi:unnamed protein product [Polarella glacialis]|uniref:Uncharacterized protein n=1 Tax=Polarella glacialis TaxID=89957 RepID=A0A813HYJ4_POLGL|nr:unnamed protein product [Polarella glacialis]